MSMAMLNTFCRCLSLIFVEDRTVNGQLAYAFKTHQNETVVYTQTRILELLAKC
jgi:hypothetical protein